MKRTVFIWLLTTCAALAATEETTNRVFTATPGGALIVAVDFGAIDVSTNAGNEVAVDVWRKITRKSKADEEKFLAENPVQFVQEGNTVTVKCQQKSRSNSHWFGGSGNRNEAKYTLRVPARFNARLNTSGGGIGVSDLSGDVNADTSGGELRFARLRGKLDGDTSGGSIRVTDCEGPVHIDTSGGSIDVAGGSGSLDADTSGGAIMVKNFRGPASVDTSGGGITLENVGGAIKGDTSGGPIKAVLPSPVPGDVDLSTSGGGITVRVPEAAAFNLEAEASGGGIHCGLPLTVQGKLERDRVRGTVNGGGPTLRLKTSGGGVHLQKL